MTLLSVVFNSDCTLELPESFENPGAQAVGQNDLTQRWDQAISIVVFVFFDCLSSLVDSIKQPTVRGTALKAEN